VSERKRPWKDGDHDAPANPVTGKQLTFHDEYGPIDPLEDMLDEYTPKYRSVRDAYEALRRSEERLDEDDGI
jgi:hypothetical protein